MRKARKGFKFINGYDEIRALKEGQKVHFCFFSNLTIEKVDDEEKKVWLRDNFGNRRIEPYSFILKYLEIEQ